MGKQESQRKLILLKVPSGKQNVVHYMLEKNNNYGVQLTYLYIYNKTSCWLWKRMKPPSLSMQFLKIRSS